MLILVQQEVIRRLSKWLSLCRIYFSIMLGTTREIDKSKASLKVRVLYETDSLVSVRDMN